MSQITANFSWEESGAVTPAQRAMATSVAQDVLEPMRSRLGPLGVNSWCRSVKRNREVGGVPGSTHVLCAGVDVRPVRVTPKQAATFLFLTPSIPVGEVIWYTDTHHLHVTRAPYGGTREFLVASKEGGTTRRWEPTPEDVQSLYRALGGSVTTPEWEPRHPARQAAEEGSGAGPLAGVAILVGLGAWLRSRKGKRRSTRR